MNHNNIIKKLTAILFFLAFSNSFATQNPNEAQIIDIRIDGNTTLSESTLKKFIPIKIGQDYSVDNGKLIVNALWMTGDYEQIDLSFKSKNVLLKLKENPFINKVSFLNKNKETIFDENIQEKIIDKLKLKENDRFSQVKLETILREINDMFIVQGFYDIKVLDEVVINNDKSIDLNIYIQEGDIYKVSNITIKGNEVFDDSSILNKMKLGKADWFLANFFTRKDNYSKEKLDEDIRVISNLYLDSGYSGFKFTKINPILNKNNKSVLLELAVFEGNQKTISDVYLNGNYFKSDEEKLYKLFGLKYGDILNRSLIIKGIDNISKKYSDEGFLFSNVVVDSKERLNNKVHLIVNIDKKNIIGINDVILSGNVRTKSNVILRELKFNKNDVYSSSKVEASIANLRRLGYFEHVKASFLATNDKNNVDVSIEVKEAETGEFSMGFVHSGEQGTSFDLSLNEKNILGTGNKLETNIQVSEAVKKANFKFKNPFFNDDADSFSLGAFYKDVSGDNLGVSDYSINKVGLSAGFGMLGEDGGRFGADLNIGKTDVLCGTDFANNFETAQCSKGLSNDISAKLVYNKNTINDFFNPSSGFTTFANAEFSLPGSDFKYIKLDGSLTNYSKIGGDVRLKQTFKGGFITSFGGEEVPFFKKYYGGGASSVRGFEFNSLGENYAGTEKSKGGDLSLLSSISASTNLTKFGVKNEKIRAGIFADAGGIFNDASDVSISKVKASVGAGLTFKTPLGPLGMIYSKPLLYQTGDKLKTFEITFGTSF